MPTSHPSSAAVEITDPELMRRLAGGDDLALNLLIERWKDRVTGFLYRMTGQRDTAVDLAQETFVRLYRSRHRYAASGSFSGYLFAIASNLAKNHSRWKGRHPTVSLDEGNEGVLQAVDSGRNPAESAIDGERLEAVQRAFLALPPVLREAMALFIHEGMGYAEIARLAHCSPKAVETRIHRARQILRQRLQDILP